MIKNSFVRVLRISAFRNLWLSQVFSQVFLNLLFFSLIIQVYQLTRSNTAVSLMVITTIIPNILIGALAGVLVDRWNRKAVMFFSHFLRALAVLLFLVSSETIVWIYILTAIIGFVTQFFFPAEGATIPEVVRDPKLLLSANSLFTLTFFASVVVGNVLAGPFLRAFGAHGTFYIVASAFLIASLFTAKLPGKSIWNRFLANRKRLFSNELWKITLSSGSGGILQNFMEGLDYIHRKVIVRRGIYYMAIGQGMIAILGAVAPGFADRILGLEAAEVSIFIMAPAALGMIVGAAIVGQYLGGVDKQRLIKIGIFCAAAVLVIFSEVDRIGVWLGLSSIFLAVFILVTLGMANSLLEIPVNTLIQENTPESVRSRVYGVIATISGTAAILPVVGAGAVADVFGVRAVMLTSSLVLFVLALVNNRRADVSSHS